MQNILKISDAASLALHTMWLLANSSEKASTHDIATSLKVSENHLAKVLQRLVKADLVQSCRGPSGGFNLTRKGDRISLLEVYEAIDGPIAECACLLGKPTICAECVLGELLRSLNSQAREFLANTSVNSLPKTNLLKKH